MLDIVIQNNEDKTKEIILINNGQLVEYYKELEKNNRKEGNIYIGIVKDVIKGMQSAFIDIGTEKNSFIHLKDALPKVDETKGTVDENIEISDVLKKGQKILVQLKKDSNEKKGARVSSHINLPGKYIALMPNTDIVTVSQKIEDKEEQKRLVKLVKENLSQGNGAVIRTLAKGKEKEIIEDIKKVEEKWSNIISTNIDVDNKKPQLIYTSEEIVGKMIIDISEESNIKITVNNKEEQKKILDNIKIEKYSNVEVEYLNKSELFKEKGILSEVEKVENNKIWLKSGGFIKIDKTEALTAIDVNTGKYTGKENLEKTVFLVNKEATVEIAKQLRLKDIGGIVIIDYIDMKKNQNKKEIEELLKKELKKDRAKTQVEGFTKLELMEMTRKHICSHND